MIGGYARREAGIAVRVINDPHEHLVGRVGEILRTVYGSRSVLGDEGGADDPELVR